jgi:hypothetical protein
MSHLRVKVFGALIEVPLSSQSPGLGAEASGPPAESAPEERGVPLSTGAANAEGVSESKLFFLIRDVVVDLPSLLFRRLALVFSEA